MKKQKATFAMGCFWKPQEIFDKIPGVLKTTVGYIGGKPKFKNPSYRQVCSGNTGYTEAIHIIYDEEKVSYKNLLKVFWKNHNPITLNRQGFDIGEQYKSAIFYHNQRQKKEAETSKKEEQKKYVKPIVTQIMKSMKFYPAEDYHQKHYEKQEKGNFLENLINLIKH